MRTRCREVVAFLVSRGATIVSISIPHLQSMRLSHAIKIGTEFASKWDQTFSTRVASIEDSIAIAIGIGASITAVEILAAEKIRAWTMNYVLTTLYAAHNLTVIATPTLPVMPPAISEGAKRNGESNTGLTVEVMKYIFLANFLGMPGYTVPVGFGKGEGEGAVMLPIGFHMLGKHWMEKDLLRLAHAIEKGFSASLPNYRPKFFVDALLLEEEEKKKK